MPGDMSRDDLVRDQKTNTIAITADVVELHDLSESAATVVVPRDEEWEPGFWNQFPWLGFCSIVATTLISVVEIIVLVLSNGKAVSQWDNKVAPNVILSVLNSGASVCIAVAVAQGVTVSWWRKAMRGATIGDLHNTWSFGSSLSAIFLNIKYFNLAALAALVTKFTIIDAVLYQRATTTYVALGPQHTVNLTTFPAQNLPVTASLNSTANGVRMLDDAFTYDVATWLSSAYGSVYSTYGFTDCEGICALQFPAPGYQATCTNQTEYVDIVGDAEAFAKPNTTLVTKDTTLFSVDFSLNFPTTEKNYTWIGVNSTSYTQMDRDFSNATQRCPGTVLRQQCELRQSMITYPVYVQLTNVSTKSPKDTISNVNIYFGMLNQSSGTVEDLGYFDSSMGQLPGFGFQHWINNASSVNIVGGQRTTNGGIFRTLSDQYSSRAYVTTDSNDTYWSTTTERQFAGQNEWTPDTNNNVTCPYDYVDPMTSIMVGLNTLTFIASDDIYNRKNWTDNYMNGTEADAYWDNSLSYVEATQMISEVHYRTNYAWMFGALASTLVCIMLILPVYWGFWELGRKVSLNPIEIANAFQAPVLANVHSGSGHADDVVKVAGGQQVAYTVGADSESGRRYRIVPRGQIV